MTSQAVVAAVGEAGFTVGPQPSIWTISVWHAGAHARFNAVATAGAGWSFALLYAGQVYVPAPIDAADLIRILNDTLGEGARQRANPRLNPTEDL